MKLHYMRSRDRDRYVHVLDMVRAVLQDVADDIVMTEQDGTPLNQIINDLTDFTDEFDEAECLNEPPCP